MPRTELANKQRLRMARELEKTATVWGTLATATSNIQLRVAVLRLIAAKLEVAAILRVQAGDGHAK